MRPQSLARDLARLLLDFPLNGVLRDRVFQFEVEREARFVEAQRKASGLPKSAHERIVRELRARANETFFILGSGASVEDDTANRFEIISQGVSVGINAWVLHDFVPTLYCFEPVPNREVDHYKTLGILNRPEVIEALPGVLVLRPRTQIEFEQVRQIPRELVFRSLLYGRVAVPTRVQSQLARDSANSLNYLSKGLSPLVTMDSGASIIRMTSLAFQLGYRRIVYVGVDLNNTEYFWERNPTYLIRRGIQSFQSGQTGSRHETLSSHTRPFPVTDTIRAIREGLRDSVNLQLYSGSSSSELANFLPVFSWD